MWKPALIQRLLCIALLVLLCAVPELIHAQGGYTIVDLGTFGGTYSIAYDINNSGNIVGEAYTVGDEVSHAFSYASGIMTDLHPLGPGDSSAHGVNDSGTVVGNFFTTRLTPQHAFAISPPYASSTMIDLGTLGGTYSYAYDINNSGTVVGISNFEPMSNSWHAFAISPPYASSTMIDLGALGSPYPDYYESGAGGINNSGTIVGTSTYTAGSFAHHAYSYVSGAWVDLDTFDSSESDAAAINDIGTIVGGFVTTDEKDHAFSYANGTMTDLGTPNGCTDSEVCDINNSGTIVGDAHLTGSGSHAFYYANGNWTDLNTLLPPNSGWVLQRANAINDKGWIVGYGTHNGQTHAFLLKPALPWGVKVTITRPIPYVPVADDYLVAFDGANVILSSDLTIGTDGSVTINRSYPLSSISSVKVLTDDTLGYNKYIANGVTPTGTQTSQQKSKTRTVHLEQTIYNGVWHYRIDSTGQGDNQTLQNQTVQAFYAIPRTNGTTTDAQISSALTSAAQNPFLSAFGASKERGIPPQILHAVAWHESYDPYYYQAGWNQFGYYAILRDTGSFGYAEDPDGQERTVVTSDGGIGMMQITGSTAIMDTFLPDPNTGDPLNPLLTHLWRLSSDVNYNIQAGAYLLGKLKWNAALPPKNSGVVPSPEFIEHWDSPLYRYNGSHSYPSGKIWPLVRGENNTDGQAPPPSLLPPGNILENVDVSDDGPPFHADLGFDGTIELELQDFAFQRLPNGDAVVSIRPIAYRGALITGLAATVSRQIGGTQGNLIYRIDPSPPALPAAMTANALGVYQATIHAALSSTLPESYVTIAVTVNGQTINAVVKTQPDPVTVSGSIMLQGLNPAALPQNIALEFRPTNGEDPFTLNTTVAPNGAFTLPNTPAGDYTVWIKGSKWLAKTVAVSALTGNASNVSVMLLAGDANNDNIVDVGDFGLLVNAFGSSIDDGTGFYDPNTDFNGDGIIDIGDFGLLVNNFGAMGDP